MLLHRAVIGCILAVGLAACGEPGSSVTVASGHVAVGSPAPDFSATTLDGRVIKLSSLKGKPVLLNFWATWCTNCRVEMPAIQAAWERHHADDLQVLAIDFRESDVAAQRRFLQEVGAKFPSVLDPDGKIADAYGVSVGLPASVFIDRAGVVAFVQIGPMTPDFIEEHLSQL